MASAQRPLTSRRSARARMSESSEDTSFWGFVGPPTEHWRRTIDTRAHCRRQVDREQCVSLLSSTEVHQFVDVFGRKPFGSLDREMDSVRPQLIDALDGLKRLSPTTQDRNEIQVLDETRRLEGGEYRVVCGVLRDRTRSVRRLFRGSSRAALRRSWGEQAHRRVPRRVHSSV
jgi:hypothetical protein